MNCTSDVPALILADPDSGERSHFLRDDLVRRPRDDDDRADRLFRILVQGRTAFRGYPLQRSKRIFGVWGAQLFVAVVFAAEHKLGGTPWLPALIAAGVGSLAFGMAAIATRGLAVPIGLHAAWNFGQWTLGLKGSPGLWKPIEVGDQGSAEVIGTIAYLVVMGSATLAFWLRYRRSADHEPTR